MLPARTPAALVPPWYTLNAVYAQCYSCSQLNIVIQQPDLLTRLECRQTNVWTPIAAESIAKRAIAAAANLTLHCEIDFVKQVVGTELHCVQGFVGVGALRGVFGFELLLHAAGAVLAGTTALARLGTAFSG